MNREFEIVCHPKCGLEKYLGTFAFSNESTGSVEFCEVPEFIKNYITVENGSDCTHEPLWLYKVTSIGLIFHNDMDGEYTNEPFRPTLIPWSNILAITYQIAT